MFTYISVLTHKAALWKFLAALSLSVLFHHSAFANIKNVQGGMLDFNVYPILGDVDNDSVATLNVAAKLNHGFSYFSLSNIYNQADSSALNDTVTFYSEQNIRWQIPNSAFDVTGQLNFRTGEDNDRHRLGVRLRINDSNWFKPTFDTLNLAWSVNLHLLQIDDTQANEWQMEHVFRLRVPKLSERLYLAGFIDHTFGEDLPSDYPGSPIVAEVQLGFRIIENLYAISEYRVNQYRRSDVNNYAFGLQYKMLW